ARGRQAEIAPVGEALGRTGGVARLKAALRLQGYDHGDPRAPVPPLPESELPALRRLLEAARLLPSALPA
ncbi:MAG: 4-hydroxy-tetrahydrodipicolinate synthase, partial [Candidatus Dormibacteraeota bacterium]|nr:4-hydroxy-tetrahydrodipicolinate synthase [Candidatus Dormibacteraeota bacterium]